MRAVRAVYKNYIVSEGHAHTQYTQYTKHFLHTGNSGFLICTPARDVARVATIHSLPFIPA